MVLECTNLVSFRIDVQRLLGVPVYDAVSLIEFFADGFRLRSFTSNWLPGPRGREPLPPLSQKGDSP